MEESARRRVFGQMAGGNGQQRQRGRGDVREAGAELNRLRRVRLRQTAEIELWAVAERCRHIRDAEHRKLSGCGRDR